MTSQNNKGEPGKVPKRTFAPPVAKSHELFAKGELLEHQGKQEGAETKGIPAPLHHVHAPRDRIAAKPIKTPKAQDKRKEGSPTARTVKEEDCKKDPGMARNEEGGLTDAQFEEIVQSALQKPLQECMEDSVKRTISAKPTETQDLGREALGVSPAVEDVAFGKKSEVIVSEMDQKRHLLKKKKHRTHSVNKDRQEKNEKSGGDNGGRKENRKGAPKKKVQGNAHIRVDQEEMQEKEEADRGGSGCSWCMAWVQCSYPTCEKWRRLSSDIDPSVLSEDWTCSQNPDLEHNSCSIPEETWSGSENEVVYAVYIPGSIVWAKQYGYPWWPGIIEADPDIGEYFLFSSQADSLPCKYHVTFFGSSVTRAWISASMLRNFEESYVKGNVVDKLKNKGDKRDFEAAVKMANEAEQLSIQERIRIFGFYSRFSGRESPKNNRDLKDNVHITCKPPAKRIREPRGGKKNVSTSNKSQEKLLPETPVMKSDGDFKKKTNIKGAKKSKSSTEVTPLSAKRSRKETADPKAAAVPKGSVQTKARWDAQKGSKSSFAAPWAKSAKAEQLSSCRHSSSPPLVLSSYPSQKDSMSKADVSPVTETELMLNRGVVGLEESSEAVAQEKEEDETFGSQEMAVFAEEKNYSSDDFSLVLFEE
ncbi:zinc finger CW-type PWWP domain protein 1 isoform X1 [Lacerta agilis]|uniref:zinc finger CW-type PWWP domain protein 1 isoform X1 n=1 Tax=Lacerta agilis TaxID=80427 RepID=UPI0014196ADE|nr:zinc finger CW-type PWWP domain protein 1 isoform X1 [Lacerta agilis]